MARIEDYALVGDLHTAALISTGGSIEWLRLPRFDSPACFNALLDTPGGAPQAFSRFALVTGALELHEDGVRRSGSPSGGP